MPRDCRDAIWFEDYRVGDAFESAPVTFTEPDIIDFGKRYDPQPFHIDPDAAKASPFGGLIASGTQILPLVWGAIMAPDFLNGRALGAPGIALEFKRRFPASSKRAPPRPAPTAATSASSPRPRTSRATSSSRSPTSRSSSAARRTRNETGSSRHRVRPFGTNPMASPLESSARRLLCRQARLAGRAHTGIFRMANLSGPNLKNPIIRILRTCRARTWRAEPPCSIGSTICRPGRWPSFSPRSSSP
jgi:hypothetical protein